MNDDIIEESFVDVVATIPAHLKDFTDLHFDSVTPTEIRITLDGNEHLKGKICDTFGTQIFLADNNQTEEAEIISCAEKSVKLEHIFYVPKDEFKKPFVPTDALKRKE